MDTKKGAKNRRSLENCKKIRQQASFLQTTLTLILIDTPWFKLVFESIQT